MRILLVYPRRLGDILRLFPACRHLAQQGHEVAFECDEAYHDIFACVDYVVPVAPGGGRAGYDRVLELAIEPAAGGTAARAAEYRASGRPWVDFVYDVPEIKGSYDRTVFTILNHCTPAEYGLPANGDYVLLAPVASAQYLKYDPAKLGAWCHHRWPRLPIHVLVDRADKRFPPFVRARRLRDLPALISWPKHFASINSATAVIAAAVRPHYVHFPQIGLTAQDDAALSGIAEVVQPYAGERPALTDDIRILRSKLESPAPAVPAGAPPLRVAFFTTLNHNVGDEFIREGIRAMLDAARVSYDPYFICKHKPETIANVWPEEVADIGDKYWNADVVVQAGAPVYWHLYGGESTSLTSEWHDWFWRRRVLGPAGRRHPLFLNLGAGSCLAWGDSGDSFVKDPGCAEFARQAGARAALTTVRESVASDLLRRLGVAHEALPCPAFLAGARHPQAYRPDGPIGVNLMPLGGHFEFEGDTHQTKWLEECLRLLESLRPLGRLVFIAHNAEEEKFLTQLTRAGEVVLRSEHWRAYVDTFAQCALVVANRVHAAVCSAGLGVPAIILGNDTRAEIGRFMDLPVFRSGYADAATVMATVRKVWSVREDESRRLLALRAATLARYAELIGQLDLVNLPTRQERAASTVGAEAPVSTPPSHPPYLLFSKTDALGDQVLASGLVQALVEAHPDHHLVWLVRDGIEAAAELFDGMKVWAPNMHRAPVAEAERFWARDFAAGRTWERATLIPVPLHPHGAKPPAADTVTTWWAAFVNALDARLAVAGSATVNWVDQLLVGASAAPVRVGFVAAEKWQCLSETVRALLPPEIRRPFTVEVPFDPAKDELGQFEHLAGTLLGRPVSLAPALAPRPASLPPAVAAELRDALVIAPGAGAMGRALPPATTAEAVGGFLRSGGNLCRRCWVLEGPGDRELAAQLATHLKRRKISHRIYRLPSDGLATLVALLRATPLFLCNDTAYVHLAAWAGTPTVAVWGLGHWPRFVCRTGSLTIVRTEMACRGCNWACCFDTWNCVQLIPAAAVIRALSHRAGLRRSDTVDVQVVPAVVPHATVRAAQTKRTTAAARGADLASQPPVAEAGLAPERPGPAALREVAHDPNQLDALRLSASHAAQNGKAQLAFQLYGRILALAPRDIATHLQIGQLLLDSGRHADARKTFQAVLTLEPGHAGARRYLAQIKEPAGSSRLAVPSGARAR